MSTGGGPSPVGEGPGTPYALLKTGRSSAMRLNRDKPERIDRRAVEVRITGRVQGVWFRAWAQEQAERLGLAGWVRNERDGSVRALFVGPRVAIEEMLRRCHEGPPAARVEAVETREVAPPPDLVGFRITG